jgi:hypothetical protein
MNNFDKMNHLMQRALTRVKDERLRDICSALALMIPSVLAVYQEIASDSSVSPAQRLQVSNTIMSVYQRVLAADLESDRTEALRAKARAVTEAARAAKMAARAEHIKHDIEIARTRRKNARLLDAAEKKLEKEKANL